MEYQHPGSPHVYMLENFDARVALIDKYITCMVDQGSTVHQYIQKKYTHITVQTKIKKTKNIGSTFPIHR